MSVLLREHVRNPGFVSDPAPPAEEGNADDHPKSNDLDRKHLPPPLMNWMRARRRKIRALRRQNPQGSKIIE
jgi:hypothetical protein